MDKPLAIFGTADDRTVAQMKRCLEHPAAVQGALMADNHVGYSMPIGGVISFENAVSPSCVGFDIACGNKAVRFVASADDFRNNISRYMDLICERISFGVGRKNKTPLDHPLFEHKHWDLVRDLGISTKQGQCLKDLARDQLGTVGSGNHYVDLFIDESERVWCGVHFGSRGLGHKITTYFLKAAGGRDGMDVPPTVLSLDTELGQQYKDCMDLAGAYAYAGRDWVCSQVAEMIGVEIDCNIHNHHNFTWFDPFSPGRDLYIVRKGATPNILPNRSFIGGSMGDCSVIIEPVDHADNGMTMMSTVHGAGRVMSRTEAAGKSRWKNGEKVRVSEGKVSQKMVNEWMGNFGPVEIRGGGLDESPQCYKRLPGVLKDQGESIKVLHLLMPIGVAMAGANEYDPYKD